MWTQDPKKAVELYNSKKMHWYMRRETPQSLLQDLDETQRRERGDRPAPLLPDEKNLLEQTETFIGGDSFELLKEGYF